MKSMHLLVHTKLSEGKHGQMEGNVVVDIFFEVADMVQPPSKTAASNLLGLSNNFQQHPPPSSSDVCPDEWMLPDQCIKTVWGGGAGGSGTEALCVLNPPKLK